jgi:predicted 3-demethylubiquinone-9 3-methyltransferase (glyoxalase superfamily)
MNKISLCLWFDDEAEEAAKLYTSIFKNSRITGTSKYTTKTPSNKPVGSILTVTFELDGQQFMALNGGPMFKFNEAISLMIYCKDQKEIDYYYEKLSVVPEAEICGWLKDKFGVSWQIVTLDMGELMSSKEAMDAMLKMKRLDINKLREINRKNVEK